MHSPPTEEHLMLKLWRAGMLLIVLLLLAVSAANNRQGRRNERATIEENAALRTEVKLLRQEFVTFKLYATDMASINSKLAVLAIELEKMRDRMGRRR